MASTKKMICLLVFVGLVSGCEQEDPRPRVSSDSIPFTIASTFPGMEHQAVKTTIDSWSCLQRNEKIVECSVLPSRLENRILFMGSDISNLMYILNDGAQNILSIEFETTRSRVAQSDIESRWTVNQRCVNYSSLQKIREWSTEGRIFVEHLSEWNIELYGYGDFFCMNERGQFISVETKNRGEREYSAIELFDIAQIPKRLVEQAIEIMNIIESKNQALDSSVDNKIRHTPRPWESTELADLRSNKTTSEACGTLYQTWLFNNLIEQGCKFEGGLSEKFGSYVKDECDIELSTKIRDELSFPVMQSVRDQMKSFGKTPYCLMKEPNYHLFTDSFLATYEKNLTWYYVNLNETSQEIEDSCVSLGHNEHPEPSLEKHVGAGNIIRVTNHRFSDSSKMLVLNTKNESYFAFTTNVEKCLDLSKALTQSANKPTYSSPDCVAKNTGSVEMEVASAIANWGNDRIEVVTNSPQNAVLIFTDDAGSKVPIYVTESELECEINAEAVKSLVDREGHES